MAEISLGAVALTNKQIGRLSESKSPGVLGFIYRNGELFVDHSSESLTDGQKNAILNQVINIPDDDTQSVKEFKAIKNKNDNEMTLDDLVKVLRFKGVI